MVYGNKYEVSSGRLAFNDFRRAVIIRFVDIGWIVNHHYLNFPFTILTLP